MANTKSQNSEKSSGHEHNQTAHQKTAHQKSNNNLIYIVSALVIIAVAGIVIFHYYAQLHTNSKIPSSINTSASSTPSTSSSSSSTPSTSPLLNYSSNYPLIISGMQRLEAARIPVSDLPSNLSAGLVSATINVYRNSSANNTLSISALNYSSSQNSALLFTELKSTSSKIIASNSSYSQINNLPSNYLGFIILHGTEKIYSVLSYNNTNLCNVAYITSSISNTTAPAAFLEVDFSSVNNNAEL